jgi:hypothetical protein
MPYGHVGIKGCTAAVNQGIGRTSTPCLKIVRQIVLDESCVESK